MSKSSETNGGVPGVTNGAGGKLSEIDAFYNCLARYSDFPSEYKDFFLKEEGGATPS
ncbi:hypothetical protein VRRI112168_16990 [Vreelandella rituensis]|uniref:hypothetical protein n=1 Tax=Vreelandella rituensis TaxID=2282306 RepID=UPI0015F089BF|nr:hypothetical protein [Halomonas rituensis]